MTKPWQTCIPLLTSKATNSWERGGRETEKKLRWGGAETDENNKFPQCRQCFFDSVELQESRYIVLFYLSSTAFTVPLELTFISSHDFNLY